MTLEQDTISRRMFIKLAVDQLRGFAGPDINRTQAGHLLEEVWQYRAGLDDGARAEVLAHFPIVVPLTSPNEAEPYAWGEVR